MSQEKRQACKGRHRLAAGARGRAVDGRPLRRGLGTAAGAAAFVLALPLLCVGVAGPAMAQAEGAAVVASAPQQQPSALATTATPQPMAPAFRARAERKDERGVGRVAFKTPYGDLVCHLPSELAPGDTVSGTVEARPKGAKDGDTANATALAALRVRLGGAEGEPAAGPAVAGGAGTRALYRWRLPREISGWAAVALHDAGGAEVGRAVATLYSRPAMSPSQFRLPKGSRVGETFAVEGAFDGDAATTSVRLGERELAVLAESPRLCLVEGPAEVLGKTRLSVREGGGTSAATAAATATPAQAEGDFAYEKPRRRSNAGPIVALLLVVGIAAVAVAASQISYPTFGGN